MAFILEIENNGNDKVIIPNKIVSGPLENLAVNLGFEILRVNKEDTMDVLKTHGVDINPGDYPWRNEFKLNPGEQRLIKLYVDNFYFDEEGVFLIRFTLKKNLALEQSLKIKGDVFSKWKLINRPIAKLETKYIP